MSDKFSELSFNEIEIGQTKNFQVVITESLVNDFAKLSGDFSPIHVNSEYANSTKKRSNSAKVRFK